MSAGPTIDLGPYADPMASYLSKPAPSQETTRLRNNKSFYVPAPRPSGESSSTAKATFPAPIINAPNATSSIESGYDAHIFFEPHDPLLNTYAQRLHSAIRQCFPHLRVYEMLDGPAGPHPTATFEVAIFSPAEFAEIVPWLTVWHGPLSVLIHTNTEVMPGEDDAEGANRGAIDHTVRALWLGKQLELDTSIFGRGGGPKKNDK